ncbi:MFS transporter [Desulfotomaculum copahuensis]|uniref:MFS transporter n=1 Tax=Desulfotomaculum copahuensis TaxID=1838280 RepID=A0A1B7LEW1_9FIRM|nr:MFS transporter [Desulfotomaculum copahuensis]OAT81823.1 MFS transporter [Desulfotomaculum copahuensis]
MLSISLSRKDWVLLLVLFVTEFARGAFYLSFLPIYAVNFLGLSVTAAGFAVSAHYMTETISKTAAGWYFDRSGRPVLLCGLLLSLFSLLLMKTWPLPAVLVLASALFGLGVSPVWLGVISEVAPVDSPDRASRIGMVFSAWLSGAGCGFVSVNFILHRGFETAFWMIILLWLVSLTATWLFLPNTTASPPAGIKFGGLLESLSCLAGKNGLMRVLIPGMFLQTFSAGMLLPVLPLFARNQLGLDSAQYGLLLTAGGGTAVICFMLLGWLVNRVMLKALLAAGFGLSATALGLLANTHSAGSAFFLAALLGFSYALVLPAWNSLLARVIPPDRQATGWGLFATVEGLGVAVGPALGSLVAHSLGNMATLLFTTIILSGIAVFYIFYPLENVLIK